MITNAGLSKNHRGRFAKLYFRLLAGALILCMTVLSLFLGVLVKASHTSALDAGDYVIAIATGTLQLDPALATDTDSFLVANQIFDTLVDYQPGGSIPEPGLAATYNVSQTGLTWTFNLRSGVKFHDGTDVDASAVVYNFQRWWDPAHPAHSGNFEYFGSMFGGFKGDPSCLITAITAVGAYQVQITLSRPYVPLPSMLNLPAFSIASPTAIQAGTLASHPIGSGPFKFVDWLTGDRLHLIANTSYWSGAPQLATLTFLVIPAAADRFTALQAGNVHSVGDLPDSYAASAVTDPQLQVLWRPSTSIGYLGINRAHSPLGNILVRQAIAHAIDWKTLIGNHYTPGDQLASQLLPEVVWSYNASLSAYSFDPALSVALLTQAGYPSGFTTTLSYRPTVRGYLPNPASTANAIKPYLDAVGIQTTVVEYESATFLNKWLTGQLDLFLLGWGADYLHPDNFYTPILCDPNNLGFGPLDEMLCNQLRAALVETNFAQQVLDYQAAGQRVYDTLPLVPIVHTRTALLVGKNVVGLVASPLRAEDNRKTYFADVEQALVSPAVGTSLVYTNPNSGPTTVEVPPDAVTQTTLLRYVSLGAFVVPSAYQISNYAFDLDAIRDGDTLVGFRFQQPVTITIDYADADIVMLKEDTLLLYAWDGTAWVDAATTCTPASPYAQDPVVNRFSIGVCHLSRFALYGEVNQKIFLPMVRK